MRNTNITFIGQSKDFKLAEKLCALCKDDISLLCSVCVAEDGKLPDKACDSKIVTEYGTASLDVENTVTYCVGQSNADVCALNFQKREISRSLELLCGNFMGRVNIPVDSEYTEFSVLIAAAALYAAGADMHDILGVINGKIR